MGWVLSLLLALVALALLGMGLRFVESLERENRSVEAQLCASRMYDEALSKRTKEIQRFRHDVNGLLQAVEYSQGVNDDLPGRTGGTSTGTTFPLVDAVVELKRSQCERAQTAFSCECDDDFTTRAGELGVSEADLCAVVQNLLENAYEASLLVEPASNRMISIRMLTWDGDLRIEVANRTASDEEPSFATTKLDAGQHGVGLRTVAEVAGKYGGSVRHDFDCGAQMLTMSAGLCEEA